MARGWLDADGAFTDLGRDERRRIEDQTDRLALEGWAHVGAERTARLHELVKPLRERIVETGPAPPVDPPLTDPGRAADRSGCRHPRRLHWQQRPAPCRGPGRHACWARPTGDRALVDVVSGSFGAGHDAAAREIADRFEARGHTVRTWDVVDLFPLGLGRLLRATYVQQLRRAPGSWGAVLRGLERPGGLSGLTSRALGTTAPGLLRIAADRPDVIVSTHPFASQALGALRATGRVDVPVATFLTDMSVHRLWVHPAVDLHLAWHPVPAAQARALGGRTAVVVPLACAGGQAPPRSRRRSLPPEVPLALVTGGALGIGQLERAARDVAATGLAHPVVLCGRNAALRHRLDGVAGVTSLGWRDDLPAVLRAMDVVVQNAGGFTSQQAIAAGVPLLSYRCLPGHGETNAAALEQAGLASWVRDPAAAAGGASTGRSPGPGRRAGAPCRRSDLVDLLLPDRARVPA